MRSDPVSPLAANLLPWYAANARDLPWRRDKFHAEYGAWGVLVSEFMLQQTQVSRVAPLLEAWLQRWPTPSSLAADSPAAAVVAWANLGYPRRALWLHTAAVQIRDRFEGVVPRDVDELLRLQGIGDYTARAVAVFFYGDRHPVVDTNTRRVIARAIHGRSQPGPASSRDLDEMASLLPASDVEAAIFNAATMELGALVCTSRAPQCELCPLADSCAWRAADYPDTGDTRPKQAKYEGSDRQTRGAILRALRQADRHRLPAFAVIGDWADAAQRDRAIDSLITDGLVEASDGELWLPGGAVSHTP